MSVAADMNSSAVRNWIRRHTDGLVAAGLFVVVFAALMATIRGPGICRDEALYMVAGETYWHWSEGADHKWSRMRKKDWIDRHYGYNSEHPPLVKHLAGLSWRIFHKCRCAKQHGLHHCGRAAPRRRAAHQSLGWLTDIQAFRLPTALLSALLVAFIYLFGAAAFGRTAGLAAALFYILMPRIFFHSRLTTLDAPVTAMMFFAIYAYRKALHQARWALPAGLMFGLALLTKMNAFFLPVVLSVHYAWASRHRFRSPALAALGLSVMFPAMMGFSLYAAARGKAWAAVPAVLLLASMWAMRGDAFKHPLKTFGLTVPPVFFCQIILGFALLFALWPHLWPDPAARFQGYVGYHMYHVFYNTAYYGRNYNLPPFPLSFPFVMTLLTVPTVTCVLAAGGIGLALKGPYSWTRDLIRRLRSNANASTADERTDASDQNAPNPSSWRPLAGQSRCTPALVTICALFPMALIALPGTPIFGGTRTWMPAMPFLALLAGWSLQSLVRAALERLDWSAVRAKALTAAAVVLAAAPGLAQTVHAGDLAPSYFVPLAGGVRAGADLGMKRQYWGYASRHLLNWANRDLPEGARLYLHDTMHLARDIYARDGLLKPSIRSSGGEWWGVSTSRWALFLYEKHQVMWEFLIWQEYGTFKPNRVLTFDGVPLITVYGPKGTRQGPPYFMDPPHLRHRRRRPHRRPPVRWPAPRRETRPRPGTIQPAPRRETRPRPGTIQPAPAPEIPRRP